ncbi:MAG: NAD-dependent epimerase/dehydratase family protein [Paludibacter sp.]|nr:NAD-dependent epimerase/dehydratase family protein [Paludibacter sp.]
MQTILGANGIIGTELAKELYRNYTKDIRLVSRHPQKVQDTDQLFEVDLLDPIQTEEAVAGSEIVYLTAGIPNNWEIAKVQWPVIMKNVLEACLEHKAKLVFFDNTYMYGTSDGLLTEETPFLATGRKGIVRAEIATMLNNAIQHTDIMAMICRAPEFYGPGKTKSITNALIFENIRHSKKLKVLLKDDTLRTLIYAPDAAKATALLGNTPDAYHQTWHLPCDNNRLTAKEFIQFTSEIYGKKLDYIVLKKWMIRAISLFNPGMRETIELLYRYKTDNLFDSSKFKRRFPDYKITTYQEGISEIIDEITQNR